MKALILKDLYSLKKQIKWTLVTILFFFVISLVFGNSMTLLALAFIFGTMQVTSIFSTDEMSSWDQFVNTLPISKANIVKSKYLLGVAFALLFILIITPVILTFNAFTQDFPINTLLSILCFVIFGALLIQAILLPIYIKFGTQKGRIVLFAIVFLPMFAMGFIIEGFSNLQVQLSLEAVIKLGYISPIFAFIFLIISYLVSVNIYVKKEL